MQRVFDTFYDLESYNIYELLENRDISINTVDFLIDKKCDSQLMIYEGNAAIYIKPDLNEYYERFLLWHELAHYLLHYHENSTFNFFLSRIKYKVEVEANTFAIMGILKNVEDIECYDGITHALTRNGVPNDIAFQLTERNLIQKELFEIVDYS